MVASTPGSLVAAGSRAERWFYSGMAALMATTVFVGFARSYYLRPLIGASTTPGSPLLTPIVHLHAVVFTGWIVLLIVQARLVAARRLGAHRRFGVAGAVGAALMVVIGTVTALHGVVRGVSPGGVDPHRFLAVPLFALAVFAVLVVLAVKARRDPQTHKRLILLATIALMPPALARWLVFDLGMQPVVVLLISATLVLPLVAWDLLARGRLHPATLWGGLLVVTSIPLRLVVSGTDAWLAFAVWSVGLVT